MEKERLIVQLSFFNMFKEKQEKEWTFISGFYIFIVLVSVDPSALMLCRQASSVGKDTKEYTIVDVSTTTYTRLQLSHT